jgi:hypothetical protein
MTFQVVPANDQAVAHIVFDLSQLPTDALEKGNLRHYSGWNNSCFVGIGYCATQQALGTV